MGGFTRTGLVTKIKERWLMIKLKLKRKIEDLMSIKKRKRMGGPSYTGYESTFNKLIGLRGCKWLGKTDGTEKSNQTKKITRPSLVWFKTELNRYKQN